MALCNNKVNKKLNIVSDFFQSDEVLRDGRDVRDVIPFEALEGGESGRQRHAVPHQLEVERHGHRNGNKKEG